MKLFLLTALALFSGLYLLNRTTESTSESRMLTVSPVDAAWNTWKQTHGKLYGTTSDEIYRKAVFAENYKAVTEHNADKTSTFTMALNKFADLDIKEFSAIYKGLKRRTKAEHNFEGKTVTYLSEKNIARTKDWRGSVGVGPVKDQGQCGSCWAFGATGTIEFINAVKNGEYVALSEQELVSCVTADYGCNGGLQSDAFKWVEKHQLNTQANYPYRAKSGSCNKNLERGVEIKKFTSIKKNNAKQMKAAINKQAVTVSIGANCNAFQLYSSGVFEDPKNKCGNGEYDLDHAVILVGYTKNAWIMRNSWAASWGDKGYMYVTMAKNKKGNKKSGCMGILLDGSYPDGMKP